MGGGSYFSDVRQAQTATRTTRSSDAAFNYHQRARSGQVHSVHPDLNILGRIRECLDSPEHPQTTPIVVGMDVTASRGNDAKAIYAEVPKLLGVIQTERYVSDPQILWAAIGDATSDKAPIQVSQFESDRRIDEQLGHIWMEEGGGGTGEESYELLAYYLAHRCTLDAPKRGVRGVAFFTGDEAPYSKISGATLRTHIGGTGIGGTGLQDVTTSKVFRDLQKVFDTYLIYPRSSMEARLQSIDEEIRKRLIEAGGQFKEVSIRASLIWNDRNDLDLHCLTPSGYHIYFGDKRAGCGGTLDVDRNVNGETTKPVENIRWARGTARAGRYQFWVENYRYHEAREKAVPFKVELDVEGTLTSFEGTIPVGKTGGASKQQAFDFVYDPSQTKSAPDAHAAYGDAVVLKKWGRYIPDTHILRIADPASAVETMLGVLALTRGKLDLSQFEASMKARRVAKTRRDDVLKALENLALRGATAEVDPELFD